jgi:hypothetical protein
MGPAEPTIPSSNSKSFTVLKLARDGTNWVTWKSQTLAMLASTRGVKRHLEGTARIPPLIPTYPDGHTLTDKEEEDLDALEKRWDDYNQREAAIMAQIFTTVPDSVLIEVRNITIRRSGKPCARSTRQKHSLSKLICDAGCTS